MTFDMVTTCGYGSPWCGVEPMILLWTIPTVLLALRKPLVERSFAWRCVSVAIWVTAALASVVSFGWLDLGVAGAETQVFGTLVLHAALASAAAVLGVQVYRRIRQRS